MTQIIQLTAENVKRISAVTITPSGSVVIIGGNNGAGKTSVLDSIAMLFGGTAEIPDMPVRVGADKAKIIAELDNGLIVKRTFTATGGTALVIENKEGARFQSPQTMLDALTGKLMFDPLAFTRLSPKAQADSIKKLVGVDFTQYDAKRKALYDERTIANRDHERAKMEAAAMPFFADAPAEPMNTADLVNSLQLCKANNAKRAKLQTEIKAANEALQSERNKAANLRLKAAELIAQAERLVSEADERAGFIVTAGSRHDAAIHADWEFKEIDEAPITDALSNSAVLNGKFEANRLRSMALNSVSIKASSAIGFTSKIEEIDAEKMALLKTAPFPIQGLSFDGDRVTFNGIPFDQASAAEQLRISVAMGAALNPKLRIMLVRDGSLLDDNSMILLAELAEKNRLQIFVERVGMADKSAIIIEDGHLLTGATPETK